MTRGAWIQAALPSSGIRRAKREPFGSAFGFTLLEVILSLALVTLVLAAMGAATVFHYRAVESAKARLAEAQLARAVLERMAQDIRGAVPYDPVHFAELIPGLVTQTSQSDLAAAASAAGLDESLLLTPGEDSLSDLGHDAASSTLPHSVPGLYGEVDWIQVDVSRLPRPDQLQSEILLSADGLLIDRVSDVKTVSYFVLDPAEAANYALANTPGVTGFEQQGGLVRRELDRALTAYLADSGQLDQIDNALQPIAPEVETVEFAYFDGSSWVDSWDSDLQGTLPTAVEIRLYLRPATSRSRTETGSSFAAGSDSADADDDLHMYRTVVYIPAAHPTGQLGATGGETTSSNGAADSEGGRGEETNEGGDQNPSDNTPSDGGSSSRSGGGESGDRAGPPSGGSGGQGGPGGLGNVPGGGGGGGFLGGNSGGTPQGGPPGGGGFGERPSGPSGGNDGR